MPKIAITDRGWKNKRPGGTENDLPGRSMLKTGFMNFNGSQNPEELFYINEIVES